MLSLVSVQRLKMIQRLKMLQTLFCDEKAFIREAHHSTGSHMGF